MNVPTAEGHTVPTHKASGSHSLRRHGTNCETLAASTPVPGAVKTSPPHPARRMTTTTPSPSTRKPGARRAEPDKPHARPAHIIGAFASRRTAASALMIDASGPVPLSLCMISATSSSGARTACPPTNSLSSSTMPPCNQRSRARGRPAAIDRPPAASLRGTGLQPPAFYHTPLLCDTSGQRLAKRHRSLSLRELRQAGHSPESLRQSEDWWSGLDD